MSEIRAKFRNPFPPHFVIAEVTPTAVGYGFQLDQASTGALSVSQTDIVGSAQPEAFIHGALVSLERDDGYLPYVGWVTGRDIVKGAPAVNFELKDWAGGLLAIAACGIWQQPQSLRAGRIAQLVLGEAKQRQRPPLLLDIVADVEGPTVNYQGRAEPVLDFLRTMSQAGLEWALSVRVSPNDVKVQLVLSERVGRDLRNEIILEESESGDVAGGAFVEAKLREDAEGYIASAMVVGGTGDFADRRVVEVNAGGLTSESGIASQVGGEPVPSSPALSGTRVIVEQSLDNEDALYAVARRQYTTPEYVKSRMTFALFEPWLAQNDYLKDIELGSIYGVRFSDLTFGLGYERAVRCVGLDVDSGGVLRMTADVLALGRNDV